MAGNNIVEYKWLPEPYVIADEYDALAFEFEQRDAVMQEALTVVIADVENQFAMDGPGWAGWAESTANDPRANSLMQRSGDLLAGASSRGSYEANREYIAWTGGAAPEYWHFHWTGTYKMPQRSWLGLTAKGEAEIMVLFETWLGAL